MEEAENRGDAQNGLDGEVHRNVDGPSVPEVVPKWEVEAAWRKVMDHRVPFIRKYYIARRYGFDFDNHYDHLDPGDEKR